MTDIHMRCLLVSKIVSTTYMLSLGSTLYFFQFPNLRFLTIMVTLNLLSSLHWLVFNIRYLTCNYFEYFREYYRFYLTVNLWHSNFMICIYLISFPCGEKCLDETQARYFTITMISSLINTITSFLIRNKLYVERIERVQPTNLIEIVVQPDQLTIFNDRVKGTIVNQNIGEKEEMVKCIIDEILYNIFLEKNQDICSICLTEMSKYQKLIKLECNHAYHFQCLYDCYRNNIKTCSLCRMYILNSI